MKKILPFIATIILCLLVSVLSFFYFGKQSFNKWYFEMVSSDKEDSSAKIIIQSPEKVEILEDVKIMEVVEQVRPSTVKIYKKISNGTDILSQIYQAKDFVGHGIILTSDGWFVSADKKLSDLTEKNIVILYQNNIYNIEKKYLDKTTGAVLLKFNEQNLPVVKFGSIDDIMVGEQLISINQDDINSLRLSKTNYVDGAFIQSSESYYNYPQLSGPETQNSTPVINFQGYLVGITTASDLSTKSLLPIYYLQNSIKNLIKENPDQQPYLGVHFLDLTLANGINKQTTKNLSAGTLLYGKLAVRAINSDSPLLNILKEGDIITAVDNLKIDAKNNLSKIILSKKSGQEIELEYYRTEGKAEKIKVKLK
jgi:serine protease Do